MATSKRISDLPLKSNLAETDLLVIVDTDAGPQNFVSKKTTVLTIRNLAQIIADAQIALQKNQPNGLATIDAATGKVPVALLPSYVDDVEEYASLASFPVTGEAGKIYVAIDSRKVYRWGGSVYVEISPAPGSTDAVPEGAINKYFTTQRAADAAPVQSVNGQTGAVILAIPVESVNGYTGEVELTKADVGLGNVDNTADADKPISSAVQSALDNKEDVGAAASAVTAHEEAEDPHPQYLTETDIPAVPVQSVNGYTGDVELTKADVGLGNVDNTADIDKPISSAVQSALDNKEAVGAATAAVTAHEAAEDPHPQYTTQTEVEALIPVQSVNGQIGIVELTIPVTTDDITEGDALYFTEERAAAAAPVQSVNGLTGAVELEIPVAEDLTLDGGLYA